MDAIHKSDLTGKRLLPQKMTIKNGCSIAIVFVALSQREALYLFTEAIMRRIAVISAILEEPDITQQPFNEIISSFKGIVRGRMGLPFTESGMAVISLTVVGTIDDINSLTGKLGRIEHISVKTAISKKPYTQN